MVLAVDGNAPSPPELIEYRLAKKFGWTPQQIRELPFEYIRKILIIDDIINKKQEAEIELARKQNG